MAGTIDDYGRKRNFGRTPEPRPEGGAPRSGPPVFVVHRHEARSLHYDLRIEIDGVLKSWAVPKGFSYDSKEKRLAVRTEDHPLEYEHFEGMIPDGEYGAGAMTLWDTGTYELSSGTDAATEMGHGELKLVLRGRRLRGHWHLVKTKQAESSWLLFKSKDRYSGPARDSALGTDLQAARRCEMPRTVRRMVAREERSPFTDADWLFEMEFEGVRAVAEKRGDEVRLRGVRGALPDVEHDLANLRAENALLDGVLVVLDEKERPSREALERRLAGRSEDPVSYYAFDLLYAEEFDLRAMPLIDRKSALRAVMPPESRALLYVDHVTGEGERLLAACTTAGLPGLVAKSALGAYRAGASSDWLRIPAAPGATEMGVSEALTEPASQAGSPRFEITNASKVLWPAEGFTKGDLVAYYEGVADVLLPYLRERPVHLNRFPDGIEGKSFYQKDATDYAPDWLETLPIASESRGEPVRYMVCNDRDTLVWFANQASIDLHPWHSRRASLDSPDWMVLDLDPKSAPFANVVRIAREAGRVLRGIGLRPLLKTSGATGLHIYVPLQPGYTYDQSRMFCESIARIVCRKLPEIATVERKLGSRAGKVYLDYGQNRRGQTIVPPYSVRPKPGATVSAPLAWDELDSDLSPARYTIRTMPSRLAELGDLFRPALTDPQDLVPAIAALERYMAGG